MYALGAEVPHQSFLGLFYTSDDPVSWSSVVEECICVFFSRNEVNNLSVCFKAAPMTREPPGPPSVHQNPYSVPPQNQWLVSFT